MNGGVPALPSLPHPRLYQLKILTGCQLHRCVRPLVLIRDGFCFRLPPSSSLFGQCFHRRTLSKFSRTCAPIRYWPTPPASAYGQLQNPVYMVVNEIHQRTDKAGIAAEEHAGSELLPFVERRTNTVSHKTLYSPIRLGLLTLDHAVVHTG